MRVLIYTFIFCMTCAVALAQDTRQSLIVVHVDPEAGSQFKQVIYSYHFLNGSYIGRDELISVAGRREGKDYVRTDLGANTLYKERYLITGIGNIIDLQEKKVLFDGRASLVRCSNDSAVFYTNDIFKGKFYSVYNFKTGAYGEVKDLLFKAKAGQDVEFDKTMSPFRLCYYPQGKAKVVLTDDAGFGQQGTGESHTPDPPLFWINQADFLYAYFNKDNTELSFYKMGISPSQKKLIGKVAIKPEKQPAAFRKTDEGLVLYLGARQIFVDLKNEVVTELSYTKPCYGFSYECGSTAAGRTVKLNEKELGKFQFKPTTFCAEKNIAAFVKEVSVGNESYQQGIAVWNGVSQKWNNVDAEEVLTLVGWINR